MWLCARKKTLAYSHRQGAVFRPQAGLALLCFSGWESPTSEVVQAALRVCTKMIFVHAGNLCRELRTYIENNLDQFSFYRQGKRNPQKEIHPRNTELDSGVGSATSKLMCCLFSFYLHIQELGRKTLSFYGL